MPVRRFRNYPPFEKDAVKVCALIEPKHIGDVSRFIEVYEGIALMRTKDPSRGLIEFWVSPSFIDDFEEIFEALRRNVPMESA